MHWLASEKRHKARCIYDMFVEFKIFAEFFHLFSFSLIFSNFFRPRESLKEKAKDRDLDCLCFCPCSAPRFCVLSGGKGFVFYCSAQDRFSSSCLVSSGFIWFPLPRSPKRGTRRTRTQSSRWSSSGPS